MSLTAFCVCFIACRPQDRQTSADFCVAVTDPKGRFVRSGFEGKVPKTADEFAAYWRKSESGQANARQVEERLAEGARDEKKIEAFRASAKAEKAKHLDKESKYLISYPMQVRLACKRRAQMLVGDATTVAVTTLAAIFQALIVSWSPVVRSAPN